MLEETVKKLEKSLVELFGKESSGHDINHLKRTMNITLTIQEKEGGNRLVIGIASLLHDIHRILSNKMGRYCTPKESLVEAKKILKTTNLSEDDISNILHCIEFHEEYNFSENGKTVDDIETLILQDADNLDAIGAIGIARTFTFGGAHNINIWIPEIPFRIEAYDENEKLDHSTIHHFYNKLLRLKDNMNTITGKQMADDRHKFMELYLEQFFDEWDGKK